MSTIERAEDLDQKANVLYNVPENQANSPDQEFDKAMTHIRQYMHEDAVETKMQVTQSGNCALHVKPRPMRLNFDLGGDKHLFLKHVRHLRQHGFRCDGDLTRLQQKQRHDLSEDFQKDRNLSLEGHS